MDLTNVASILVALIAAFGAWAAQKSAAKANKTNTQVSGRLEAEREAYERARAFDLRTIERQDQELRELRDKYAQLEDELSSAKQRIAYLENEKIPTLERQLHGHHPHSEVDDSE